MSILENLFRKNSKKASQEPLILYADCSELPLKTFLIISQTGDFSHLIKKGEFKGITQEIQDHWGKLLLEYASIDNNNELLNRFELQKDIIDLQNAYSVIKAMLKRLMIVTPDDKKHGKLSRHYINDLMKLGYKIDDTSNKAYRESIILADKRSNSLITQIQMKRNQLKGDVEEKDISFESIVAVISSELKFMIPDDISVARYCEFKKIIKRRVKIK